MTTLYPKIITFSSHPQNRGSCDWGWSGLVGYGCHRYVVVADLASSQVTQVLGTHKENVACVKWKPEDTHHDVVVNPYTLTLAAGDTSGDVIIWNVTKGELKSKFSGNGRSVRDISWITNPETSEATILVLYNKSDVIMWDFLTSSQLWRTSFSEPLSNISIDPFSKQNAIFLCEDSSILLVDDLQPRAAPSQKYRRVNFYGSTGPYTKMTPFPEAKDIPQPNEESARIRRNSSSLNKFLNMTTSLITGINEPRTSRKSVSDEERTSQCLQVVYHPGIRHVVFMVYPSQVDIIDIEVCIVVSTIRLDSKSSPFVRVIPCKQKDVLYCLHENSCITIRVRRQDKSHCICTENQGNTPNTPVSPDFADVSRDRTDITYDLTWQSDAVRLSNQSTVYGFCVHPGAETGAALIFSDGKILLWELVNTKTNAWILEDILPGLSVKGQKNLLMDGNRFLLTGMIKGFPSSISTIKSNLQKSKDTQKIPTGGLLALGLDNGTILLLDIHTGQIDIEFSVHSNTVKGIEWTNQGVLLSWTCSKSGSSGSMGRNEVLLTTIQSGMVEVFRHRLKLESLITDVKVSPLRQYAVIAFKAQGLEIWCLQTKSLLREMHDKFLHPRALTWSPICTWRTVTRQRNSNLLNKVVNGGQQDFKNVAQETESRRVPREECVMADRDGVICRLTLEERSIADITIFPPENNGMSTVTHIDMKDDVMILSDVTGAMYLMNTTEKTLKSAPRPYPGIRSVLFHPTSSDHRCAVLYDQGMDVWLMPRAQDQFKLLWSIKHSKATPKIQLFEWADLNHISMVMDDGSIHVVDITSSKVTCTWSQRNMTDTAFYPHTLPAQASTILKYLLQNIKAPNMEYRLNTDKEYLKTCIDDQLQLLGSEMLNILTDANFGTGHRCLLTARLFGDEFDVNFWIAALYFLSRARDQRNNDIKDPLLQSIDDNQMLTSSGSTIETGNGTAHASDRILLDCLQSQDCFWKQQLHRIEQHNKKRASSTHRRRCIEHFTMMGRVEEATKILLETDFQSGQYREDYLQACLLSCDRSNTTAQSTLKLVATHLIISGKLQEGVEILCLLGKILDACKYLQTYDQWEQAAWLAKLMLNNEECEEIYLKWIEHLISSKQMLQAIFIMMSLGKFADVLKTLHYIGYLETGVSFLKACQEHGFELPTEEADAIMEKYGSHIERLGVVHH